MSREEDLYRQKRQNDSFKLLTVYFRPYPDLLIFIQLIKKYTALMERQCSSLFVEILGASSGLCVRVYTILVMRRFSRGTYVIVVVRLVYRS
jgi:hypothetical protein